MKIAEIRSLSAEELRERIKTETANYESMKFNHKVTPLENPCQIREARRTIARMKTVLGELENQK